ncbi:MAG: hypothetical protein HKN16_02330 [Saprospiraceae bacterium]|nr:hypothetical protein [Saprospiraceae bacterium]
MNNNRTWGIVAVILALLLAGVGYWGYGLKNDKASLADAKTDLETQLGDMGSLKESLEMEIDSLSTAYDGLSAENETLLKAVKDEKARVANRNWKIKGLQKTQDEQAGEMTSMRSQIEGLLATRTTLQNSIFSLQAENDSLKTVTGLLESDLRIAKDENVALNNLNTAIQEEVGKLTLANFKASAFRVEIEKKNSSRVTSKGKRAKRIRVSFDLTDVPEKYHGVRPLYLVITDDKATPVKLINPVKAQVSVNGQPQDILAAEVKEINLEANQRLEFIHELGSKLSTGFYRVAVYTDIGLLGANSFRLR